MSPSFRKTTRLAVALLVAIAVAVSLPRSVAEEGMRPPEVGDLLVASRGLKDPNFRRSVVLIIRYEEEGAVGIVVNRPLDVRPVELLPEIEGLDRYEGPLFKGGPVGTDSFALLVRGSEAPEGTRTIAKGVHLGSSREILKRLAASEKSRKRFRLYLGYAGWGAGQLDWELRHGGWHLVDGDRESIFSDEPSDLWKQLAPAPRRDWVMLRERATSDPRRRHGRRRLPGPAEPVHAPRRP